MSDDILTESNIPDDVLAGPIGPLLRRLEGLEVRVTQLETELRWSRDLLEKELLPVAQEYRKRFGYSFGKNCPHCGALIGHLKAVDKLGRCPRCEGRLD